jgi:hypothetical protein
MNRDGRNQIAKLQARQAYGSATRQPAPPGQDSLHPQCPAAVPRAEIPPPLTLGNQPETQSRVTSKSL